MKQLQTRLVLVVATLLTLSALLLSWLALRHFDRELPPEMGRTVTAVGYSAEAVLKKAYESGIPPQRLVGTGDFFAAMLRDNPDVTYIVLADAQGRILAQSGYANLHDKPALQAGPTQDAAGVSTRRVDGFFDTRIPLVFRQTWVGTLHLGQSSALVAHKLRDVAFDVATVLLVSGLIAHELLRFVLAFVVATPAQLLRDFLARTRDGDFSAYLPADHSGGIGQLGEHFNQVVAGVNQRYHALAERARAGSAAVMEQMQSRMAAFQFHPPGQRTVMFAAAVDHIRWPFFLLIFADSFSLSFFPLFVEKFYSPMMGVSKTLVVGLPISVFMFTWALSMPWAGMWSDRVGHRKAFLAGAAVTTLGLVLTSRVESLVGLLVWRSLSALGYGLVFVTAQSYIAKYSPADQRTRAMAVFLSTFFAGSLSGSAIGGILADRIGDRATILLSAILSAGAALFVAHFLRGGVDAGVSKKRLTLKDFGLLLRNGKFLAITFLAAVPAKVALTGFLYYSAPLYLKYLGNNQSTTGRVMMAYGLAIIVLSSFLAKLADRYGRLRWFITIGGMAAAASMFIVYQFHSTTALLASITLLGVAHAIGVSPQLSLINDLCQDVVREVGAGTTTGIFRLIERLGNVLGPILAGILISQFGYINAFLGMGLLGLCCTTLFTLMFIYFDRSSRVELATI